MRERNLRTDRVLCPVELDQCTSGKNFLILMKPWSKSLNRKISCNIGLERPTLLDNKIDC